MKPIILDTLTYPYFNKNTFEAEVRALENDPVAKRDLLVLRISTVANLAIALACVAIGIYFIIPLTSAFLVIQGVTLLSGIIVAITACFAECVYKPLNKKVREFNAELLKAKENWDSFSKSYSEIDVHYSTDAGLVAARLKKPLDMRRDIELCNLTNQYARYRKNAPNGNDLLTQPQFQKLADSILHNELMPTACRAAFLTDLMQTKREMQTFEFHGATDLTEQQYQQASADLLEALRANQGRANDPCLEQLWSTIDALNQSRRSSDTQNGEWLTENSDQETERVDGSESPQSFEDVELSLV